MIAMAELFFSVPFRRGGLYIIGVPASLSECRYSLHFSLFFFFVSHCLAVPCSCFALHVIQRRLVTFVNNASDG